MAFAKSNSKSRSNAFVYFSRMLLVEISSSHKQMYTNAFLCISLPKTGVSGGVGSVVMVFDDCDLQRKTT